MDTRKEEAATGRERRGWRGGTSGQGTRCQGGDRRRRMLRVRGAVAEGDRPSGRDALEREARLLQDRLDEIRSVLGESTGDSDRS
jgi:hypothetical protein